MGVGASVGVAGVAVGTGVGVGLEQAATSAANANKIMRVDSFDMEAAKLLRLVPCPAIFDKYKKVYN